jgi:hypothetical protein
MSMKSLHALTTLILGLAVGVIWLRSFWRDPNRVPVAVLMAPVLAGLLGLGHWVTYDFSLSHWAGDFSLLQAVFNILVAGLLLSRRSNAPHAAS